MTMSSYKIKTYRIYFFFRTQKKVAVSMSKKKGGGIRIENGSHVLIIHRNKIRPQQGSFAESLEHLCETYFEDP